ncbi:hypothetical protein EJ06DRAFT_188115 [Trichodelitschia bisporula]|uniref:Uncharacterized protein n=1 Tax=Trichodelitschia bisporula TaxID=703511 RepID=A0A6G1I7D4_9PEZI|nr:hypothetical protein EJ06DRAFT_188115 [Trichodelitschia bisporula]
MRQWNCNTPRRTHQRVSRIVCSYMMLFAARSPDSTHHQPQKGLRPAITQLWLQPRSAVSVCVCSTTAAGLRCDICEDQKYNTRVCRSITTTCSTARYWRCRPVRAHSRTHGNAARI